jgi:hypothetical protein
MHRHAAGCAECRETIERERALIEALRRSAPPVAPELPPFLKGRILANVERAGTPAASAAGTVWRRLQPWAVAGVAFVLLVSFWPRQGLEVTETVGPVPPPLAEVGGAEATVASWSIDSTRVLQWAELADQPLQGELANAVDDGRRLITAALYSVVPDATAERILAQAENWVGSDTRRKSALK